MEKVKVIIEKSSYGFSAYMASGSENLEYGVIGEGKTVQAAMADFKDSYEAMKTLFAEQGEHFTEAEFEFYFDTASFLEEYCRAFSLAGLERITGVSQTQLGHYLHGRSKPSPKTVQKIQNGVEKFARSLTAVRFV